MAKSTSSSPREPGLNSQHRHDSQLQFQGIRCPVPASVGTGMHWCTDIHAEKDPCIENKIIKKKEFMKSLFFYFILNDGCMCVSMYGCEHMSAGA